MHTLADGTFQEDAAEGGCSGVGSLPCVDLLEDAACVLERLFADGGDLED